jgi:hypothetical protein
MSIFDFLHSFIDKVRPQRGRVAFQAPEPISNEEYQAYRQAEIAALEAKYDLSSAEGIMAIPRDASLHHGGGIHSYTGDIDYYLRNKGYGYEKAGNIELAILCLKKSNEIRMFCRNGYRRDDYYSLVRMLALHGRVDEAQAEKDRIDLFFDSLDADTNGYSNIVSRALSAMLSPTIRTWFSWTRMEALARSAQSIRAAYSLCPGVTIGFHRFRMRSGSMAVSISGVATAFTRLFMV